MCNVGGDFVGGSFAVVFPPSDTDDQQTINITLVQDSIFEPLFEGFFAVATINEQLNNPADSFASEPLRLGVALIIIEDSDSEFNSTVSRTTCFFH